MIQVIRETHRAPASVARRLEIAGGVNRFGRPNYRAVWGWSRLGWIGGKWEDRGAGGELVREVVALRPAGARLLVLFLGSTVGNFETGADVRFLSEVRSFLRPGDSLLLGTDLLKPSDRMLAAYDDALGVTAAFNINLLARINRELDGDFDLRQFEHMAPFNEDDGCIEMHLRSKKRQTVHIRSCGYDVAFEAGETIWTESCRKYTPVAIDRLAAACGFRTEAQWIDRDWPFAESLWLVE